MKKPIPQEVIKGLTDKLVADGKLIEAGWIGLRMMSVPPDAPPIQIEEMRNAFFAGAQHLFSSIMTTLDPSAEPTEGDMEKLSKIDDELQRFIADYMKRNLKTEGSA